MEDRVIVGLYWKRDESAIVESQRKYGRFCHRIAENILSLREDAEECVSDTWVRAWNTMPPQRPDSLRAFLGRIVRNLSISRYRADHAQKRYAGLQLLLSELGECVPAADTVEQSVDAAELSRCLSEWLRGLPVPERNLFLRRYWNGETVRALAAWSGRSPSAVQRLLQRLRMQLRAHLEREGISV